MTFKSCGRCNPVVTFTDCPVHNPTISTQVMTDVAAWASAECARQESGELSVGRMIDGWVWAFTREPGLITLDDVRTLGKLIEPIKNVHGFRRQPVLIDWLPAGTDPSFIDDQLTRLLAEQPKHNEKMVDFDNDWLCTIWYKNFELIHPFADGNGRVGSILYNIMANTLSDPYNPPDIFGKDK